MNTSTALALSSSRLPDTIRAVLNFNTNTDTYTTVVLIRSLCKHYDVDNCILICLDTQYDVDNRRLIWLYTQYDLDNCRLIWLYTQYDLDNCRLIWLYTQYDLDNCRLIRLCKHCPVLLDLYSAPQRT